MNQNEIIKETEEYVLHTYNRFPVALDHGEGVRVWDAEGKEYLDFMAGIGVYGLGYHFPGYDEAMIRQLKKTIHTSNLYYHEPLAEAARKLVTSTGMKGAKAFFTNSGTEAVEGAIKAARKYAWNKSHETDGEIISVVDSFHGRSIGALSVTGNRHYQEAFRPLMGGVRFAKYNSLKSVENLVNDKTCAIILETVQGEGGVYPADQEFLTGVRKICDERDIVLILDEIQCGMGRTGSLWAFDQYGVKPDIMTCAKALGCGVPVGAFVVNSRLAEHSLVPGDHGTTYGGNPLATAMVSEVFDLYEANRIPEHAKDVSKYLAEKLDAMTETYSCILAHRGKGLLRGLELVSDVPAGKVANKALEKGLLIITADHNVLRFLPPLIIEEADVDEAVSILDQCFAECEAERS